MLSLPLITPRDSHELWFGSSQTPPYRSSASQNQPNPTDPHQSSSRRYHQGNAHLPSGRVLISSAAPANTLAALQLEERALRARKQNIASFGYAWIKPAGCAKTMLGMREEEAEREEGLLAAAAEMGGAGDMSTMGIVDEFGRPQGQAEGDQDAGAVDDQMLERDLDDDIPDADADGLVEEGEEGLEEDEDGEEGLMERDLDDDIPEAFPEDDDDDDEDEDDFDNQPDLDDDIPAAEVEDEGDSFMVRDLDDDVPEAAEEGSEQGEEWQHTDTEAEDDDEEDGDDEHDPFAEQLFRTSASSGRGLPPQPPPIRRETEAQRRFLNRWSGGADAFDSSGMMLEDEDDLRASIASQTSRRNSAYRRRFSRRTGGPRDSLE